MKCPIIVRGRSNIDPNFMGIRHFNGDIHCRKPTSYWKAWQVRTDAKSFVDYENKMIGK